MRTPAIIALSIIGVLGTTGAAMAVNSATLAGSDQGTIGKATDVLVPSSVPADPLAPTSTPTPEPGSTGSDDDGYSGGTDDAGTSPTPSYSDDDGYDDGYDDDSDEYEDDRYEDSDDSIDDEEHESEDDD